MNKLTIFSTTVLASLITTSSPAFASSLLDQLNTFKLKTTVNKTEPQVKSKVARTYGNALSNMKIYSNDSNNSNNFKDVNDSDWDDDDTYKQPTVTFPTDDEDQRGKQEVEEFGVQDNFVTPPKIDKLAIDKMKLKMGNNKEGQSLASILQKRSKATQDKDEDYDHNDGTDDIKNDFSTTVPGSKIIHSYVEPERPNLPEHNEPKKQSAISGLRNMFENITEPQAPTQKILNKPIQKVFNKIPVNAIQSLNSKPIHIGKLDTKGLNNINEHENKFDKLASIQTDIKHMEKNKIALLEKNEKTIEELKIKLQQTLEKDKANKELISNTTLTQDTVKKATRTAKILEFTVKRIESELHNLKRETDKLPDFYDKEIEKLKIEILEEQKKIEKNINTIDNATSDEEFKERKKRLEKLLSPVFKNPTKEQDIISDPNIKNSYKRTITNKIPNSGMGDFAPPPPIPVFNDKDEQIENCVDLPIVNNDYVLKLLKEAKDMGVDLSVFKKTQVVKEDVVNEDVVNGDGPPPPPPPVNHKKIHNHNPNLLDAIIKGAALKKVELKPKNSSTNNEFSQVKLRKVDVNKPLSKEVKVGNDERPTNITETEWQKILVERLKLKQENFDLEKERQKKINATKKANKEKAEQKKLENQQKWKAAEELIAKETAEKEKKLQEEVNKKRKTKETEQEKEVERNNVTSQTLTNVDEEEETFVIIVDGEEYILTREQVESLEGKIKHQLLLKEVHQELIDKVKDQNPSNDPRPVKVDKDIVAEKYDIESEKVISNEREREEELIAAKQQEAENAALKQKKEEALVVLALGEETVKTLNEEQKPEAFKLVEKKNELEAYSGKKSPSIASLSVSSVAESIANLVIQDRIGAIAIAAGDEDDQKVEKGLWVKGIYGVSNQKTLGDLSSYKGKSFGGAVGADIEFNEDLLIGAAVSNIVSKFKFTQKDDLADANSLALSIYGSKNLTNNLTLHGVTTFVNSKIKASSLRYKNANHKKYANAKFDSFGAFFDTNLNYQMRFENGVTFVPTIGLKYSQNADSAFDENGAGIYNLSVASRKSRVSNLRAGATLSLAAINVGEFKILPTFKAIVNQEFYGKSETLKTKMIVQDNATEHKINLDSSATTSAIFGAGLNISRGSLDFGVNYNATMKKKFQSHEGSLKLRVNF